MANCIDFHSFLELPLVSALLTIALLVGDTQSYRQSDGHEGINSV